MTITKLHEYTNGDFNVTLLSDGTKIREGKGVPIFPESMDIKITNWCDAACAWCHEQSTKRGEHADLEWLLDYLKPLPSGVEIAIGGGHPLSHPLFVEFISEMTQRGIVCNVTINEFHFEKSRKLIERLVADKKIYGVGYSFNKNPCLWKYDNLVTHVIIGVTGYEMLEEITQVNRKVLLLGYKDFGRGSLYSEKNAMKIEENINGWYKNLFSTAKKAHLSFDNLAISQLNPKRILASGYDQMFMGNDGEFTMYIDAVQKKVAIGSTFERVDISCGLINSFEKIRGSI